MGFLDLVVERHQQGCAHDMPVPDVPRPDAVEGDGGLGSLKGVEPGARGGHAVSIDLFLGTLVARHDDFDGLQGFGGRILSQQGERGGCEARVAFDGLRLQDFVETQVYGVEQLAFQQRLDVYRPFFAKSGFEVGGVLRVHFLQNQQVVRKAVLRDGRPEFAVGHLRIGERGCIIGQLGFRTFVHRVESRPGHCKLFRRGQRKQGNRVFRLSGQRVGIVFEAAAHFSRTQFIFQDGGFHVCFQLLPIHFLLSGHVFFTAVEVGIAVGVKTINFVGVVETGFGLCGRISAFAQSKQRIGNFIQYKRYGRDVREAQQMQGQAVDAFSVVTSPEKEIRCDAQQQ